MGTHQAPDHPGGGRPVTTFKQLEQEARARSSMLLEKMANEYLSHGGDIPERVAARVEVELAIMLGFAHTAALAVPYLKMLGSKSADQRAEMLVGLAAEFTSGFIEAVPDDRIKLAIEENQG